jgi:hypothetical protein
VVHPNIYSVATGSGIIIRTTEVFSAPASEAGFSTVQVTDAAPDSETVTINIAPARPTNLTLDLSWTGPQDLQLNWVDNAVGEEGFEIFRKVSGGTYVSQGTTAPNIVFYNDLGLDPSTTYSYKVLAYRGLAISGFSNDDFGEPQP